MPKDRIAVMFMGLAGSGKDTQAELIKKFLEIRDGSGSVLSVNTGHRLRAVMDAPTYTSKLLKENILNKGAKAPDFLALWAWGAEVVEKFKVDQHIIFGGSPRTALEANVLDEAFEFFGIVRVYPIYLRVERQEAFYRLKKRGRFDDTDERINSRLNYFETYVVPAIEYYRKESKNKVIEIDGNPHDEQKIHKDITQALGL